MRKKARLKQLTLGIAAALLAGSWQVPAWAAEQGPIKEDTTLTADTKVKADKDTFKGNISNGVAAVYANGSLDLNMAGHNLDLDVRNLKTKDNRGSGLQIRSGSTLMVHSDKQNSNAPLRLITINARGNWSDADQHGGATSGIRFDEYAKNPMKADIHADVQINEIWAGREFARGIWAPGKATLNLDGTFTIKPGAVYHYWTEAGFGNVKSPSTYGIHVTGEENTLNIRRVDIDDSRIQRGIQFGEEFSSAKNSVLRIGGGKLKIADNKARDQWLMWVKGSGKTYFNVNEAGTDATDQKTELAGPVHTENGGEVYLGLNGVDSKWLGGTEADATGKTTLFLKNGATWDTMNGGRGTRLAQLSSTNGNEGNIFQNDAGKLMIDDYAGRQKIYYSHTGGDGTDISHYTAGDTHIKKAAANSFVTMVTDSTNPAANEEQIHKTLNALAGKLYYEGTVSGQMNLKGKAMLTEGLTASSAALHMEGIAFDTHSGQGRAMKSVPSVPPGLIDTTDQIAEIGDGGKALVNQWKTRGITDGTGHYTFQQDVVLRNDGTSGKLLLSDKVPRSYKYVGNILVNDESSADPSSIDMRGHKLTLHSEASEDGRHAIGIGVSGRSLEFKNVGGIDINIRGNKNTGSGIYAMFSTKRDGGKPSKIVIGNDDRLEHAVRIRNTATGKKEAAIRARGYHGNKATVDIKGLVDIEQDGADLIDAGSQGEIHIGGGRIIAKGDEAAAVSVSGGANVYLNSTDDGHGGIEAVAAERDVQIEGNVLVRGSGVFGAALKTKNSYLKGLIGTTFKEQGPSTRLYLGNGAYWENVEAGKQYSDQIKDGSHLTNLKVDRGTIFQKDVRPLTIDQYSGTAKLFYEHEGDGTEATHYKAGDTHIKKADANSSITVATDRKNITTTDEGQVYKVLNTLAGKLYYEAAMTGETNLKGKAMIAEGLTESSAAANLEDITFKEDGQGSVKEHAAEAESQIAEIGASSTAQSNRWKVQGQRDEAGNYTFRKDLVLRTKTGSHLLNMGDYVGNVLMNSEGVPNGSRIDMQKHKLTLDMIADSSDMKRAVGIGVIGTNLSIKNAGAVDINIHGDKISGGGIYVAATAEKKATLTIANDDVKEHVVKIRNTANGEKKAAITAKKKGANDGRVEIKGLADIEQEGADLLHADGGEIRIGGGRFIAKGDDAKAVKISNGGKVYINAENDSDGVKAVSENRDVQMEGNVMLGIKGGTFGAALTTKDSYIKGRIGMDIMSGSTRLYLANGAYWENISNGSMSTDFTGSHITHLKAKGGTIFQNDTKPLTIDRLSGRLKLFYKHVNDGTETEDYGSDPLHINDAKFYGYAHIKHADPNSEITMVTDSNGITMSDENQVRKALNALASKLYYEAAKSGEANLKGKAAIAEGLTTSSNMLSFAEMDYWQSNGRAYVKSADTSPLPDTLHKQIAESNYDANEAKAYWQAKGVYDGNGNYTFRKNIKLVVKAADRPVISAKDNKFGTIYWNGDVEGSIDMTGHRLDIKAGPGGHGLLPGQGPNVGWERTPNAITVYSGTLTIKNVKGMNIETDPHGSLYGRGIFVMGYPGGGNHQSGHGRAKLVIENDDDLANAVKIRVDHTRGEDFGAIEARKNMGSAEVDIKGLVDIDSKMWRAIESHGARISIGGGIIKGTDVASIAAYDDGTVFVNSKLDENGNVVATSKTRPVKITGDISSESNGHVVLGLNNKDSFFKGLVSTDINGINKQTQQWGYIPGNVSMLLANGATWEHKQVGTGYHHKKETGSKAKGIAMDSRVTRLQADKGILKQNDPHKITIDNYSGNMQLVYQHEGDGTKAEHYKAGDVHIKKAAENSSVTMVTDSNGLTLTDETQVYKTLNALAGKLYYDGYKTGERNLKGEAMISEGLVASSKTLKKANMDWSESSGQGSVKVPQPKPEPQPQPKPEPQPQPKPQPQPQPQPKPESQPKPEPKPQPKPKIEYGDYETKLMSGVKSAMTASTMAWRAEANDLMKRMGDLRLSPEDEGVWARVYRGKSSSDKDKTNFEMNYTTIQVGYDKKVGDDWRVGVAGSYMKGSSSYENGSGKNKEGNLGVYGTWSGKNGEYVDLIAKIGRLANEYTVYNSFGHYVKGDFHTWGGSLSAEYGRRISLKGGSFVEPQIELIYSHLNGVNYTGDTDYAGQKMYVRQGAMNSFVGRIGLGFGQETERSTWFLKASVYHEFAGDLSTDYSDGTNPWKTTHQEGKDTWLGLQLGGTMKLSDKTSLYGTFEKTFGGDIKTDWRVDAGLRWSF